MSARLHEPSGAILAVSMKMLRCAISRRKNYLPHIMKAGRPAQFPDHLFRRCNQYPRVARSMTYDFMGDWAADSFLAGVEYLEYRYAEFQSPS